MVIIFEHWEGHWKVTRWIIKCFCSRDDEFISSWNCVVHYMEIELHCSRRSPWINKSSYLFNKSIKKTFFEQSIFQHKCSNLNRIDASKDKIFIIILQSIFIHYNTKRDMLSNVKEKIWLIFQYAIK